MFYALGRRAKQSDISRIALVKLLFTISKMCASKLTLTRMAPKLTVKHYKAVSIQAIF